MARYQTLLLRCEEICEGTAAFYFARPAEFRFRAGQYVDVTLLDPAEMDTEGPVRSFSLCSAPYESELMVATRLRRSAFKRVLHQAPTGTKVQLEGPAGSFTLHKNAALPTVWIAGGIGITPFRSMLRQAIHEGFQHQLYLFYGNSRPRRAAFLTELGRLAKTNPRFHFVPLMETAAEDWKGELGLINPDILARHLPPLDGRRIYYVAGPPEMVGGVREQMVSSGFDEDDIRAEEFGGY